MNKILIVSSAAKSRELLVDIVKEAGDYEVSFVSTSAECKLLIRDFIFDLIIINSPLYDEVGENLTLYLNEKTNSSIILILKKELNKPISNISKESEVLLIEKPLNKMLLINTINLSMIYRKKIDSLISENEELKLKIKEIKLIDRAKYTLMEYLRMSEEQAHRYIEKQAMDLRIKKIEVAKNILKIYEV